ncbi:MAG TPA: ChbG/HpnK family deacetylase [Terriglobia bacterium]|jgi:hopanoid biosynthesis associated protein HpnK|nr:ChbG/HpnK family deacetylase [Terriglobia bacterium]
MKKLIVNADDFGLSSGVNRAILEGHRNGIITSTTLMANGPAFDSAVAGALTAPGLGVGVHLNLTQGRPVCEAFRVPSLIQPDGAFHPTPGILAWRIMTGKIQSGDIENELRTQIAKVASSGVRITHLDSHKHIHLLPPVFRLVLKLACEFGIRCVRCPVEPASSALGPLRSRRKGLAGMARQFLLARALSTLASCQVNKVQQAGLWHTKHFVGLSQTGFLDAGILEQMLRSLPEGTTELMCHPGYVDDVLLGTRTRLRAERETELRALTRAGIRQFVDALGIELISYAGLPQAKRKEPQKSHEPVQEFIQEG